MFQKMRIFAAVARRLSFTEAAFELGISQSAVSQAVAALEKRFDIKLVERRGRSINLTSAGRFFADESMAILDSVSRLEDDLRAMTWTHAQQLHIAYSNLFSGDELQKAVVRFSGKYPQVAVSIASLCHESIYEQLLSGRVDLALSDQRRAFSNDFENVLLAETPVCAELSLQHPFAVKKRLTVSELRTMTCILVVSEDYQDQERDYYARLLGFRGRFQFAETRDAARLMVSGGNSFLLSQGKRKMALDAANHQSASTTCIPIFRSGRLIKERFCAFCLKEKRSGAVLSFLQTLSEVFACTETDRQRFV